MKNIISSIFSNTEERIKNPFIGSFLISWIVLNWQGIMYFFLGKVPIEVKLEIINNKYVDLWSNLYIPFFFAIIYTTIIPWFLYIIEVISKKSTERRTTLKYKESREVMQAKKAKIKSDSEYEELRNNYSDIKALNDKIQTYEAEKIELNNQISTYQDQVINLEKDKSKLLNQLNNSNSSTIILLRSEKEINSSILTEATEELREFLRGSNIQELEPTNSDFNSLTAFERIDNKRSQLIKCEKLDTHQREKIISFLQPYLKKYDFSIHFSNA